MKIALRLNILERNAKIVAVCTISKMRSRQRWLYEAEYWGSGGDQTYISDGWRLFSGTRNED